MRPSTATPASRSPRTPMAAAAKSPPPGRSRVIPLLCVALGIIGVVLWLRTPRHSTGNTEYLGEIPDTANVLVRDGALYLSSYTTVGMAASVGDRLWAVQIPLVKNRLGNQRMILNEKASPDRLLAMSRGGILFARDGGVTAASDGGPVQYSLSGGATYLAATSGEASAAAKRLAALPGVRSARLENPALGNAKGPLWCIPMPPQRAGARHSFAPQRVDLRRTGKLVGVSPTGDRLYWLLAGKRPDVTAVTKYGHFAEVAADHDLLEVPLGRRTSCGGDEDESRVLARGLPPSGVRYDPASETFFWRMPRSYPDHRQDLYYLCPDEKKPRVVRDFPPHASVPVAFQGRLYWLERGSGNHFPTGFGPVSWGDLYVCEGVPAEEWRTSAPAAIEQPRTRLALPLIEGSDRAYGEVPLFVHDGHLYLVTAAPAQTRADGSSTTGPSIVCTISRLEVSRSSGSGPMVRKDPDGQRAVEMPPVKAPAAVGTDYIAFPGLRDVLLVDGGYLYFTVSETRKPWNDRLFDQSQEKRVTALYRVALP